MPKFLTIGYGDQAGYDRTGEDLRNAAHAHDAGLQALGALMARAGEPIQVRNHENKEVQSEPGAFMQSELPIAGFMVIEAADADEAVRLVAKTPCAVAYGVVEVWPLVMS
ncbi:MAG: YciI family protein [Acidimicrobiales bacterium]